jgi:predicted DNA-binding ribbon-helix-helix protein
MSAGQMYVNARVKIRREIWSRLRALAVLNDLTVAQLAASIIESYLQKMASEDEKK